MQRILGLFKSEVHIDDGFHSPMNEENAIFISNLDQSVEQKELMEIFKPFGDIVLCHIDENKKKEQTNIAFIEFSHEKEAENAISKMNGDKIKGNQIKVQKYLRAEAATKEIKLENSYLNASTSSHIDDAEDDDDFDDD
ncbi:hypothetical protein M9Y10_035585 [Tritrichomonas musculus]|uniref:RRM domain-containing protein n=1 Tax=Tritrichomonas musculus TaxID=1915356 RepID=A0ABR2GW53_9EUKA